MFHLGAPKAQRRPFGTGVVERRRAAEVSPAAAEEGPALHHPQGRGPESGGFGVVRVLVPVGDAWI